MAYKGDALCRAAPEARSARVRLLLRPLDYSPAVNAGEHKQAGEHRIYIVVCKVFMEN
jgi:hypothetical protein